MTDQPKPATEWTAEYVAELAIQHGNASQNVAAAHNAALAALEGRIRLQSAACDAALAAANKTAFQAQEMAKEIAAQLAAERETAAGFKRELHAALGDLAAEREKVEK